MIDLAVIFELSKTIIPNQRFDVVLHTTKDFMKPETRLWHGRVWADLTCLIPFSTRSIKVRPGIDPVKKGNAGPIPIFEGSVEHLLHLIFSRYQNRDFQEGLFLLKAEFGADWFTPVLQHPHCVIRQPSSTLHYSNPTYDPTPDDVLTPEPSPHLMNNRKRSLDSSDPIGKMETYVLFYLGPNTKDFCAAFHPIGIIPGVNSWYFPLI